jgi:hypothetical protein
LASNLNARPGPAVEPGKMGSKPPRDDRAEFGVLFVGGFASQAPGGAVAVLASALYGWLFRWNQYRYREASGKWSLPAHLTLDVQLRLSTREREAHWVLAESPW